MRVAAAALLGGAELSQAADPAARVDSTTTPRRVLLAFEGGRLLGSELLQRARGAPTLRLRQGETVELQWRSDRPMVLHLHGYGLEAQAGPSGPATMRWVARAAGRFPVETHGADGRHATVLYVEVHPR
jgi:hypothetical protein